MCSAVSVYVCMDECCAGVCVDVLAGVCMMKMQCDSEGRKEKRTKERGLYGKNRKRGTEVESGEEADRGGEVALL